MSRKNKLWCKLTQACRPRTGPDRILLLLLRGATDSAVSPGQCGGSAHRFWKKGTKKKCCRASSLASHRRATLFKIQTLQNLHAVSQPSLCPSPSRVHRSWRGGEVKRSTVRGRRVEGRGSVRRGQKVSESSESFSVVPSLEGPEGFLGLRGPRGPVPGPLPPWWGSCLSREPGEGAPERSRPPSERWLLGTAAPGPPSSDHYELPGGEEFAALHLWHL